MDLRNQGCKVDRIYRTKGRLREGFWEIGELHVDEKVEHRWKYTGSTPKNGRRILGINGQLCVSEPSHFQSKE